jgi:Flp pilus assembly protein CpaB
MQRNRPILIAAAVLGILAVGLTLMTLLRGPAAPPPPGTAGVPAATPAPIKQVVAVRNILPRTIITAAMVREEEVTSPVTGGLTSVREAVGKLASDLIPTDEVLTDALLTAPVKRTVPANFAVPPGTRAVAIMVDPKATIGGLVDVGDHVDVVVVHKLKYKNEADQEGETRSGRTIAQNLLVLATDPALEQAKTSPTPAPTGPADPNAPPPPPPAPTPPPNPNAPPIKLRVIVAAPPVEAARLAAAMGLGDLHLTLRDPSSIEESAVPESFEYPIRTIGRTVPRPQNRVTGSTNSGNSGMDVFKNMFGNQPTPGTGVAPMEPPRNLPGQGSDAGSGASAPAEAASEVTVIRGTEKTRVIVPQR